MFIRLPADGCLGCYYLLAVGNSPAIDMCKHSDTCFQFFGVTRVCQGQELLGQTTKDRASASPGAPSTCCGSLGLGLPHRG